MPRRKRTEAAAVRQENRGGEEGKAGRLPLPGWAAVLAVAFLLSHAVPLLSSKASIQWDAVDVHYCAQRYLSGELWAARLPVWTPYILSGFPFLADPQVGAFYPLNWPFVLAGAGPKLIQAEIALHALLAMAGMLLFLRLHLEDPWSASLGAMAYALSGFFAGHASHVGMVQGASLLPWLLYGAERALRGPWGKWLGVCGAVAGLILLAGHFQTALYAGAAMSLYVIARAAVERRLAVRALGLIAGTAALAFLVSAAMTLPGLELTRESIRYGADYSHSREGVLEWKALATLADPDALGAVTGSYRGPGDRTQYYFYAGILVLPLAAVGLGAGRAALLPLILAVTSLWFMLGPDAGLYRLAALIPWFRQVRAPVHAWFVAAFALAWMAAAGMHRLRRRFPQGWAAAAVCLILAADLAMMNSWSNPLAYMRGDFDSVYGAGLGVLRQIGQAVPPGRRFAAPDGIYAFGPLNGPLLERVETTYGYNPLQLRRYAAFREAAAENPRLLDALSAALWVDPATGKLGARNEALARAWFPAEVRQTDEAGSRAALRNLQPSREAVVEGANPGSTSGQVLSMNTQPQRWRIRFRADSDGLLALSLPWFPGWEAVLDGRPVELLRVNHALSGVAVPAGEHELVLEFRSRLLPAGAALSVLGCGLAFSLWKWGSRRTRAAAGEASHGNLAVPPAGR